MTQQKLYKPNKLKTIVAIGGGEIKNFETLHIDRIIVNLVNKKKPKVLFIPTASNDNLEYWENFKNVYSKKLKCITDVLFLLKQKIDIDQIKNKVFSSDIIYVGGGNTLKMLKMWKKLGIDKILIKAYKKGIILSGLSAGAICWFKFGLSDSRKFQKKQNSKFNYIRVSGLGLIPCTVSPHHVLEKIERDLSLDNLIKKKKGVGLAIDDNTALLIQGSKFNILSSIKELGIKKVIYKNNKIEKKYIVRGSGNLNNLLNPNQLV